VGGGSGSGSGSYSYSLQVHTPYNSQVGRYLYLQRYNDLQKANRPGRPYISGCLCWSQRLWGGPGVHRWCPGGPCGSASRILQRWSRRRAPAVSCRRGHQSL
jgi:hypothetical protein